MRPDEELIARARDGDLDAYAEFVRRYEGRVASVLRRLLADAMDVEEATQDVFVQAWRNLDRFRGDASVFTWLYRIAVNEALMRRRRKQIATTELEEVASPATVVLDAQRDAEVRQFLLARIDELPFEYRAPLVLRDLEGLSNQEVADILELSVAAVKSRIHRARMEIRAAFEAWEGVSE